MRHVLFLYYVENETANLLVKPFHFFERIINFNKVAWDNLSSTEQQQILTNLLNIFQNGSSSCN